jgi:hypothetical protein
LIEAKNMAVVIEELDVQTQAPPPAPATLAADAAQASPALDEHALQAALQREAWRLARLAAD